MLQSIEAHHAARHRCVPHGFYIAENAGVRKAAKTHVSAIAAGVAAQNPCARLDSLRMLEHRAPRRTGTERRLLWPPLQLTRRRERRTQVR
jgi:hypothetical protein